MGFYNLFEIKCYTVSNSEFILLSTRSHNKSKELEKEVTKEFEDLICNGWN